MHTRLSRDVSVLVVEDDSEIAEFLKEVLGESYAVESVGDARAALAHLERASPDVILLDCLLPGGGAADVLERAGKLRCSVVVMSGRPEVLDKLGIYGHPCLRKPFRIAELHEAIEAARDRQAEPPS